MNTERKNEAEQQKLETEVRAVLSGRQRQRIPDLLIGLGAEYRKRQHIKDVYYCPQNVTSFNQLEMNDVGSFSVRLREVEEENGQSKVEWNIKQITNEGDHTAWAEYETEVSSFEMADKMVEIMGFKPFIRINKNREIYSLAAKSGQEYSLLVEDIENFGPVLEVETFSTRPGVAASRQFIHDLMLGIGITTDQIVKKSVTNMIMRQQSRF